MGSIRHGLTLACLGDPGGITYKRSRRGEAEIDCAMEHVLGAKAGAARLLDFAPYGYDERQFGSPGFDLPVGSLSRTPHSQYPEYHTSADDLAFITADGLADSLTTLWEVLQLIERNRTYRNLSPKGEPQLGRRGLYPSLGGGDPARQQLAMLWVLNQSDGSHSLLDIAERSALPFAELADAADRLASADLLGVDG